MTLHLKKTRLRVVRLVEIGYCGSKAASTKYFKQPASPTELKLWYPRRRSAANTAPRVKQPYLEV
jgi:hypothetical protein